MTTASGESVVDDGTDATTDGGDDARLAARLVEVARLMITNPDLTEVLSGLLRACTELAEVQGAGLLLADPEVGVRSVACTTPELAVSAVVQQRTGAGPALDVLRRSAGGAAVDVALPEILVRWPAWGAALAAHGVRRLTALPLSLVDAPMGALELYSDRTGPLSRRTTQVGAVFAGLAVVVVQHDALLRGSSTRAEQLARALEGRVAVEQAKGYLCACAFPDPDVAFAALRYHARRTRQPIDVVARAVVGGELPPAELRLPVERRG